MGKQFLLIADADIIIAQAYVDDANHQQTMDLTTQLIENGAHILFPATAIAEAITTMQRKLSNPQLAGATLDLFSDQTMTIEAVDQEIIREAKTLFNPLGSKKNTLFDCIVATLAKKHNADAIFSFDGWYEKLGYTLVKDLF